MADRKYWSGNPPKHCDLCRAPIKERFIDGAMKAGPWAIMCPDCHTNAGVGLGTGRGQMYEKESVILYYKIGG